VCREKPVCRENGYDHDYCSRSCAKKDQGRWSDQTSLRRPAQSQGILGQFGTTTSFWQQWVVSALSTLLDYVLSLSRPSDEEAPDETSLRELAPTTETWRKGISDSPPCRCTLTMKSVASSFAEAWKPNDWNMRVQQVYEIIPARDAQEGFKKYAYYCSTSTCVATNCPQ
jgi:hypothetical protein